MENPPFEDVFPIQNEDFHCYVRLPECNHSLPNLVNETMSDVERNQLISTRALSKVHHLVGAMLWGEAGKSVAWMSLLMKGYHYLGCIFNSEKFMVNLR